MNTAEWETPGKWFKSMGKASCLQTAFQEVKVFTEATPLELFCVVWLSICALCWKSDDTTVKHDYKSEVLLETIIKLPHRGAISFHIIQLKSKTQLSYFGKWPCMQFPPRSCPKQVLLFFSNWFMQGRSISWNKDQFQQYRSYHMWQRG